MNSTYADAGVNAANEGRQTVQPQTDPPPTRRKSPSRLVRDKAVGLWLAAGRPTSSPRAKVWPDGAQATERTVFECPVWIDVLS